MSSQFVVIFVYGPYTYATRFSTRIKYESLIQSLCDKWKDFDFDAVSLTYSLPGHSAVMLDNDDDLCTMLSLIQSFGIHQLDISVHIRKGSSCIIDVDSSSSTVVRDVILEEEDIESDLLPAYCPHDYKELASSDWDHAIANVGQFFHGLDELRLTIDKFSVAVGFKPKFLRNEKRRVTVVCSKSDTNQCPWRVHALRQSGTEFYYIKELNNVHNCGACQSSSNSRVTSRLVSKLVADQARGKPLSRPSEIVFELKDKFGLDAKYHTAWRGVEIAKSKVYGDPTLSFDQLRWYGDELLKTNPGSRFELEVNQRTRRFERVFVAFEACISGFEFCRPMLFVDGTFLKGRYKGTLLSATGKDGDQGLFPFAFAIVDSENQENWTWFMRHLSDIISPDRILTFVSDRHAGILHSVKTVFPQCYHSFCLQHLKYNLRTSLPKSNPKWRENLVFKFRECAYAPTKKSFDDKIESLRTQGGGRVQDFLNNLPAENWSNAYFRGKRYGEMWSNVAESFNAMICDARNLPITQLIDSVRVQVMEFFSTKRGDAKKWVGVLCPEMNKRLQQVAKFSKSWHVKVSSDDIYEVKSYPSCTVNIRARTCSCCQWQLNGFPCAHAAAAVNKCNKNLVEFVELFFYANYYRESYGGVIEPVSTVEKPIFTAATMEILPPKTKVPVGRPPKKRKRQCGDVVRTVRCGRCNTLGHNKTSCKAALN